MDAGEPLMAVSGMPVLEYIFAEDHGWSFTLHRPKAVPSRLQQSWDTEPVIDTSELDLDSVTQLAIDATQARVIRNLLSATPGAEIAPAFAEALGLPVYRWLSPDYAQSDPDSFKERGARQIGTLPKNPLSGIICPPVREISLPRSDLSAREALALCNGVMGKSHPEWFPVQVFSQGGGSILNHDGRLAHGGEWCVKYRQAEGPAVIRASIRPDLGAQLVFMAERIDFIGKHPMPEAHIDRRPPLALPDDILDSPEVMATASRVAVPDDLGLPKSIMLFLGRAWVEPIHWEIRKHWWDQSPHVTVAELVQAVDWREERLLGSVFERLDGNTIVERWQK
ncbi:hypothetical protein [Asticcacaulis sp. 201]|uniref:hypothetical protein n=1 Tax=Asticcacaulis sp. 201 TaxID=3028787 RepID=UPI0029166E73|nr:hypothetical protein [Asticcacaulis sp. 201]MDV6330052.1 hypothetical protein [Asticcacaulis sp. 201]